MSSGSAGGALAHAKIRLGHDVETAYRSYVTWMEAKGDEATDDPTPLPEERLTDHPPSD